RRKPDQTGQNRSVSLQVISLILVIAPKPFRGWDFDRNHSEFFYPPPKKDTHKCGPMRVYPYFPSSPSSKSLPSKHKDRSLLLQFPLPTPPKHAPELPKTSIIRAKPGPPKPPTGLGLRQSSGALEWSRSHPGKAKHFTQPANPITPPLQYSHFSQAHSGP